MDDLAGGVEGAGGFTGGGPGLGVDGSEEVFEDAAKEFGIEGDVFFERGVFLDGEFIVAEDAEETARGRLAFLTEQGAEVGHGARIAEEKEVGDERLFLGDIGEPVDAKLYCDIGIATGDLVEALEEAAVEKGNTFVEFFYRGFFDEQIEVAEEALVAVVGVFTLEGAGGAEAAFFDRGGERGEEQVLQDGLVVTAGGVAVGVGGVPVGEQAGDFRRGEKAVGQEVFFAEKPRKDETSEQANEGLGIVVVGVFDRAFRKPGVNARPIKPVANFGEETAVQSLNIEGLAPGFVEGDEAGDGFVARLLGDEFGKGEVGQDFKMRAMGLRAVDVFDEGDLFENIARAVSFMQAAVDDAERKDVALPEEQQGRHIEEAIEGAGGVGQFGAGVSAGF